MLDNFNEILKNEIIDLLEELKFGKDKNVSVLLDY